MFSALLSANWTLAAFLTQSFLKVGQQVNAVKIVKDYLELEKKPGRTDLSKHVNAAGGLCAVTSTGAGTRLSGSQRAISGVISYLSW